MRSRVFLLPALFLCACSLTRSTSDQLARVAKDWCLTIRASQVIPTYPLTEDLQVGDVFLVNTPLDQEIKQLEADGFLPLENHIGRMTARGFNAFYDGAYGVTDTSVLPRQWQFPNPPRTTSPTSDWAAAPGAAFPSYTFQIKKGTGASLALPIQSVPIGLSLMHTGSAYGSVNIMSASTYGLTITEINPQVNDWAAVNRQFLSLYAPRMTERKGKTQKEYSYVRVVHRVYVAAGVNVSLISDSSTGGRLDAGASKPVTLFDGGNSTSAVNAANNYKEMLSALNTSIASTAIGANVQIASASSRSVAMNETFPRPLVVGYLAFDRAINDGGFLGPPIPTQARVTGKQTIVATASLAIDDTSRTRIEAWLNSDPSGNSAKFRTWLTQNGYDPARTPVYVLGEQWSSLRLAAIRDLQIP